jgi:hypothetical protein
MSPRHLPKPPQDPRDQFAPPPFPRQQQAAPGREGALKPVADHGQESYVGHGRLAGRAALITGAIVELAAPSRCALLRKERIFSLPISRRSKVTLKKQSAWLKMRGNAQRD